MLKSLWVTSYLAIVPMLLGWIIFYFLPTFYWDYQLFHVFLEGGGCINCFYAGTFCHHND